MNSNRTTRVSLKSVGADGTHWRLVMRQHDRWAILREGIQTAVATGSRGRRFLSLTVAANPMGKATR